MKRYSVEVNGDMQDQPSLRAACSRFRAAIKAAGDKGHILLWDWSKANDLCGNTYACLADWQDGKFYTGQSFGKAARAAER